MSLKKSNNARYYSQHGEDYILCKLFDGKQNGFYVDVGAFDGVHLSNSFTFEQIGWKGVCIEANPDYIEYCTRNRPGSYVINCAASAEDNPEGISFFTEKLGLLSSTVSGDEHLKDTLERYSDRGIEFEGTKEITVDCRKIDTILDDIEIPGNKIDFLSIDTEGNELEVLKGIDLKKYDVRVIITEANSESEVEKQNSYLSGFEYIFARKVSVNCFFVKAPEDAKIIREIIIRCFIEPQVHPLGIEFTQVKFREGFYIDQGIGEYINEIETYRKNLEKSVKQKDERIENILGRIERLSKENERLNLRVAQLKEGKSVPNDEFNDIVLLNKELDKSRESNLEKDEVIDELITELEELKKSLWKLEGVSENKEILIKKNEIEISSLRRNLDETENTLEFYKTANFTVQEEKRSHNPLIEFIKSKNKKYYIKGLGNKLSTKFNNIGLALKAGSGTGKYEHKKINLKDELGNQYGDHRTGWKYSVSRLEPLHSNNGTKLDTFIERRFCWKSNRNFHYDEPWTGIIHVPPFLPDWYDKQCSNQLIFASVGWRQSLKYCQGLFCLTEYHRKYLDSVLDLPIQSLYHPTDLDVNTWSIDKYEANRNKSVIQVGWWLRRLHAIFELEAPGMNKIFLKMSHPDVDKYLSREKSIIVSEGRYRTDLYESAQVLNYLPAKGYDKLLSENILFAYLYDSSACNLVIESIARGTPLLINRLEPLEEYLGVDYPLFYGSLREASAMIENEELIYSANNYLLNLETRKKLNGNYFLDSFYNSEIYKSLPVK